MLRSRSSAPSALSQTYFKWFQNLILCVFHPSQPHGITVMLLFTAGYRKVKIGVCECETINWGTPESDSELNIILL